MGKSLGEKFSSKLVKEDVSKVMAAVADWQISHFKNVYHHNLAWTNGALYSGMMQWAKMTEDKTYLDWLYRIGRRYNWQPYYRMYHADDIVVSQMYLDMYRLKNDERIMNPTKAKVDWVIDNPSSATLLYSHKNPGSMDRWSWCDALFMAPPVYAQLASITGDKKYMKYMHKEFMVTYNFLYNHDEHLFFRDHNYFDKRENNGAKVFWGRGNGWVMGGLVNILKELPVNSKYRPFYEQLFKEMAAKVITLQDEKGYWHASMLDVESYPNPETSASGFFCYALDYGVNQGLLGEDKYLPAVTKGWQALVTAVFSDGKLGWVQPIGEDPKKVTETMTEVYGVGAFLLAGSEIIKLSK